MSYIILRSRLCDIIVLNVHAPTEDKIENLAIIVIFNSHHHF
jgi:hypothetical protein